MRLLLRLDDAAGGLHDLTVEFDQDATIGELADHLAALIGGDRGQTLRSAHARRPDRAAFVAGSGPRSGETVSLVPPGPTAHASTEPAPVVLTPLGPSAGAASQRLSYGSTELGGAAVDVSDRVEIRATGSASPTVNGARVRGSRRLRSGDLLGVGDIAVTVRIDGTLDPPPRGGPSVDLRPYRRGRRELTPIIVELPTPPDDQRMPGFPVLSAMVPLLMGAALWIATRSLAAALFVLFSFVFVVASGLEARREARADRRFRIRQLREELAETEERLEQRRRLEREYRDAEAPDADQIGHIVSGVGDRLWERDGSHDGPPPMSVRLGLAMATPIDHVVVPLRGRKDLRDEVDAVAAEHELLELPTMLDLEQTGGLCIVGRDESATGVARNVIMQLASLVGPDELQIRVVAATTRSSRWRWCDWLPHTSASSTAPRTLLVVDDGDPSEVQAALSRYGDEHTQLLWLSATTAALPSRISAVLDVDRDSTSSLAIKAIPLDELQLPARVVELQVEAMGEDEALPLARALAPLVPVRSTLDLAASGRGAPGLPARVGLGEIVGRSAEMGDPSATIDRWDRGAATGSLAAPVGRVGNGVLHLDLREDGPHALIAGTTGAGKSEFLRTFVASAALHHGPDRLTFLLVDYKGGAAFRTLTDLPHSVGLITDLDPVLATRVLVSLRAEVRHRERLLASLGLSDLQDAAEPDPAVPPALVVVVDEFATLARELPPFVDGLIDIAQRGRSLGIHLVLATQRPSGVVTDAIRANTGLRIALRVGDADDSSDVVDVADAASIPRDMPGRAVLRVGPNTLAQVQIAFSGGPASEQPRVRSRQLGEREPEAEVSGNVLSELEVIVRTARDAADLAAVPAPRRPWLDPLPDEIDLTDVLDEATGISPVVIGWIDRPEHQRRDPLRIDLHRDGGVLVLGASGSGRSTTLSTIAQALCRQVRDVVIHGIDAGSDLMALRRLSQVGDIVSVNDAERVLRLLRIVAADVAQRIRSGDDPSSPQALRVLLIDGIGALEELHERVNRGEAMDLLTRVARDGRSVGVHVVVAAARRVEVPSSLAASLGCQIMLRCATEDEAMMLGLGPEAAARDMPPGRGVVRGSVVQIAHVAAATHEAPLRSSTGDITALPTTIRLDDVSPPTPRGDAWRTVVIGLEADRLGPAVLDLGHHHAIVAGPPRSGRSTTLATIARSVRDGHGAASAAFLLAAHHSDVTPTGDDPEDLLWTAAAVAPEPDGLSRLVERTSATARAGTPTLFAVDDLPDLLDGHHGAAVETALDTLMDLARTHPLRIVVSGEIDSMSRCYVDVMTRLRAGRTGVLLRPDPDLHGSLLHAALPRREELPDAVGRGWLIGPGTAVPVQVAQP